MSDVKIEYSKMMVNMLRDLKNMPSNRSDFRTWGAVFKNRYHVILSRNPKLVSLINATGSKWPVVGKFIYELASTVATMVTGYFGASHIWDSFDNMLSGYAGNVGKMLQVVDSMASTLASQIRSESSGLSAKIEKLQNESLSSLVASEKQLTNNSREFQKFKNNADVKASILAESKTLAEARKRLEELNSSAYKLDE